MPLSPMVVALAGYSGVGKDTAAAALVERGWTRIGIADAINDALLAVNPVLTTARAVDSDEYGILFTDVPLLEHMAELGWDETHRLPEVRTMLEELGAWGRSIDPDFWLQIAVRRVRAALSAGHSVVVPDVRHHRENYAFAADMDGLPFTGKTFWVQRPGVGPVSEDEERATAWFDEAAFDAVLVNNGSVSALQRELLGHIMTRQCSWCDAPKAPSSTYCKECRADYQRAYRARNPGRHAAYEAKYRRARGVPPRGGALARVRGVFEAQERGAM